MAMESINGKMAIDMKVLGITVSSTEKDLIYLRTAMFIQELIIWVNPKEKVSTSGKMEVYIQVNSKTV